MRTSRTRLPRLNVEIPADVGDRFLSELTSLVERMAKEGGFKQEYQAAEMLSKYCEESLTPANVRRSKAIEKWLSTEQRNQRTNARLQVDFDKDFGWAKWESLRDYARKLIAEVLEPVKYLSVIQDGVHTNGASTRVGRSPSAALLKLTGEAHCSTSARKHWDTAFSYTRLSSQKVGCQEFSVLFTVPKKSDIDRVACKEPEANMLLQKSVGNHIRRRLKVYGQDLNDQTVNQRLSQEAVAKGLATVDLSSASDSITRQLVIELLPFEWWTLLDDLRVKTTFIPDSSASKSGKYHDLEMFSSMGNGFTFELESLIFYALTRAVARHSGISGRISVYGDDIICPVGIIPRLTNVFGFCGFKLNPKKTHASGFFRESCGAHWWKGFDVKPFYVRRAVRELPDLINHLNHLLEWDGRGWGFFITEEAYRFWKKWSKYVPEFLWGGIHPTDTSTLVTGHSPRKRIVVETRRARRPAQAGLDLWLLARDRHKDPYREWCQSEGIEYDIPDGVLVVDPHRRTGYLAGPVVSCGERTSWLPGAAFSDPRQ